MKTNPTIRIALASAFASLAAVILSGCAGAAIVQVGPKRAPIAPEQVRLYLTPPPKFEEVGLITSSSGNTFAFTDQGKMNAAVEVMKRKAASVGANGVLLRGAGTESGGMVGFTSGSTYGGSTYSGTTFGAAQRRKSAEGIAIFVR